MPRLNWTGKAEEAEAATPLAGTALLSEAKAARLVDLEGGAEATVAAVTRAGRARSSSAATEGMLVVPTVAAEPVVQVR